LKRKKDWYSVAFSLRIIEASKSLPEETPPKDIHRKLPYS